MRMSGQAPPGAVFGIRTEDHAKGGVYRLVGLAHDDRIDEGGERERIAKGQRSAGEDERVMLVSLLRERRDARELHALNQSGQLGFVRHRNRDDRVVGDRPQLFIGDERAARLLPSLEVVRQKRPVCGSAFGRIDRAIDGLVAEG